MNGPQIKKIGNMELYYDKNHAVISLDPNIFPLDVVYSASYLMLEKATINVSDSKKEITVELRPIKKEKSIEEIGREFNNELVNLAYYKIQTERKKNLKDSSVHTVDIINDTLETSFEDEVFSKIEENLMELEQNSLEDPLGISKHWEDSETKQ